MRLTLRVHSYCDQPAQDQKQRTFDHFPVILGRSNACDYTLPDASRYISSNHAVIVLEDGALQLQDTSANGTYVNGATSPLGRQASVALHPGDRLAIGDYIIECQLDDGDTTTPVDDPFDVFATAARRDPAPAEEAYDPFRGAAPDWSTPTEATSDPFGDDWEEARPSRGDDDDWADWSSPAPASSRPSSRASDRDAAPPRREPAPRQRALRSTDPRPPPATRPPAPSAPTPAPVRQPERKYDASVPSAELVEAFLAAAKLDPQQFRSADDAALLASCGAVLHQAIDTLMVLLHSRTEMKNAIRSDITTLERSNNNPLKFSYSAADALSKMLDERASGGFLAAGDALDQAAEELKIHQLAMLEGMKAAMGSILRQFDPERLTGHLQKSGSISANIPITREAKLWELFCEQYDAIREEAERDFNEFFGREFRKAYEKRIRELGRLPDF